MGKFRHLFALVVFLLMPLGALAQEADVPRPVYSQAQLQQMLAPIALYPDALIAQILMASTYPLEVVEAYRWVQNPANAALRGDQLTAVLEPKTWDPSVKSLVPFPQILRTLNDNIEWTERLGDAFLAQEADVMDNIQRLRQEALAAGHLTSTQQQTVETQGQSIIIIPANPDVIYVPTYDPNLVYGDWIYSDYRPYYFSGYPYIGAAIGFGLGFAVINEFWGWNHWDWRHRRIDIDDDRFRRINRGQPPHREGEWQHDPEHRRGVPYSPSSPAVHEPSRSPRFSPSAPGAAPSMRDVPRQMPAIQRPAVERPSVPMHSAAPVIPPSVREVPRQMPVIQRPVVERPSMPRHSAAPVFESFSPRGEVRRQTERGMSSRAASTPSGGGGNRGDDDRRRHEGNR